MYDFYEEGWCSSPADFEEITPGSFDVTQVCGADFDGTSKTASFTDVVVQGDDCTFNSFDMVINWSLLPTSLYTTEAKYIKVSISGPNQSISVKAFAGGEDYAGTYEF